MPEHEVDHSKTLDPSARETDSSEQVVEAHVWLVEATGAASEKPISLQ